MNGTNRTTIGKNYKKRKHILYIYNHKHTHTHKHTWVRTHTYTEKTEMNGTPACCSSKPAFHHCFPRKEPGQPPTTRSLTKEKKNTSQITHTQKKVNICFLQQFSVSNPHETCISPLGFPRKPGQPWNLPPTQKIPLPPQPKKQKTSRNNSAPVKQIPYYIKYQGQRTYSLSLCMNFGKSWAYHTPWCASHPTWNSSLIAWGHSCGTSAVSPPKKQPLSFGTGPTWG